MKKLPEPTPIVPSSEDIKIGTSGEVLVFGNLHRMFIETIGGEIVAAHNHHTVYINIPE